MRVSEKTKKSVENQDQIQIDAKDSAAANSAMEPSLGPYQQEQHYVSRYPYSPDHVLDTSAESRQQANHIDQDHASFLNALSRERTPSIFEPNAGPIHEHSRSISAPQRSSMDELWMQNQTSPHRPKPNSSTSSLPENSETKQLPHRTSAKYLTPHYTPAPPQRQHASSFSAYSPPRSSTFADIKTLDLLPALSDEHPERPLQRPRTHSAPDTRPATTRTDTTQIIKSRRLSIHPSSLLPGPDFSPYRPPTPPASQNRASTPPPPIPTSLGPHWPLPNKPSNASVKTLKEPHTQIAEDASTASSSLRSPSTSADNQSLNESLSTPLTATESPVEQGLAAKVTFQRRDNAESKVLVTIQQTSQGDKPSNSARSDREETRRLLEENPVSTSDPREKNERNERSTTKRIERDAGEDRRRSLSRPRYLAYRKDRKSESDDQRGRPSIDSSTIAASVRARSMSQPRYRHYIKQKESMDKDSERSGRSNLQFSKTAAADDRARSLSQPRYLAYQKPNTSRVHERSGRPNSNANDSFVTEYRRRSFSQPRYHMNAKSASTDNERSGLFNMSQPKSHAHTRSLGENSERSGRQSLNSSDKAPIDDRSWSVSQGRPHAYNRQNVDKTRKGREGTDLASVGKDAANDRGRRLSRPKSYVHLAEIKNGFTNSEQSQQPDLTSAERAIPDDRRRSTSRPRSESRARSGSRPRYYALLNEANERQSEDKLRANEEWKAIGGIGVALSEPAR